jgi:hypothetical protein
MCQWISALMLAPRLLVEDVMLMLFQVPLNGRPTILLPQVVRSRALRRGHRRTRRERPERSREHGSQHESCCEDLHSHTPIPCYRFYHLVCTHSESVAELTEILVVGSNSFRSADHRSIGQGWALKSRQRPVRFTRREQGRVCEDHTMANPRVE